MFCAQFLDKAVVEMRSNSSELQKENSRLTKSVRKRENEVQQLQKRIQHLEMTSIHQNIFPCDKCTKNFVSLEMLNIHMQRKHPVPVTNASPAKGDDLTLINTIKLELEIKQLKEELNKINRIEKERDNKIEEPSKTFTSIGIQSNLDEVKDKDDSEENLKSLFKKQEKMLENWKNVEQKRYESDVQHLQREFKETVNDFKEQTKQLIEENTNLRASLPELQVTPIQTDDSLWKDRYSKLEKMYLDNQSLISKTINDLNVKYTESLIKPKINVVETQTIHLVKTPNTNKMKLAKTSPPDNRVHVDTVEVLVKENSFEDLSESSSNSSSLVEEVQSSDDDDVIVPDKPTPIGLQSEQSEKIENLLQKNVSKPKIDPPPVENQSKKPQFSRNETENILNKRLRELGIDPEWKTLPEASFNSALLKLAQKREVHKKKFNKFFVVRNKLLKQIEQKVREIDEPPTKIPIPKKRQVVPPKPMQRTSQFLSSTPRDPPVPKKRVIFDLEPKEKPLEMVEDVSDWDISSFNTDN